MNVRDAISIFPRDSDRISIAFSNLSTIGREEDIAWVRQLHDEINLFRTLHVGSPMRMQRHCRPHIERPLANFVQRGRYNLEFFQRPARRIIGRADRHCHQNLAAMIEQEARGFFVIGDDCRRLSRVLIDGADFVQAGHVQIELFQQRAKSTGRVVIFHRRVGKGLEGAETER